MKDEEEAERDAMYERAADDALLHGLSFGDEDDLSDEGEYNSFDGPAGGYGGYHYEW